MESKAVRDRREAARVCNVALMASPVDAIRLDTRYEVPYDAAKLAKLAHKYLTLATEYTTRNAHPDFLNEPLNKNPIYPSWTYYRRRG
jgi:hypothetical protein